MPDYEQGTLMPVPDVAPLPEPADLPRDAAGKPLGGIATWSRYAGKHQPCGRCVRIIHAGIWNHHPHPARRRRKGPNGDELLCVQHGEMQETRDARAKADAKARAAETASRGRR